MVEYLARCFGDLSLCILQDQYIYIHDCIKQALMQGMSARWKPEEQKTETEPIYENAGLAEPEQIYENTAATGSGEMSVLLCFWHDSVVKTNSVGGPSS